MCSRGRTSGRALSLSPTTRRFSAQRILGMVSQKLHCMYNITVDGIHCCLSVFQEIMYEVIAIIRPKKSHLLFLPWTAAIRDVASRPHTACDKKQCGKVYQVLLALYRHETRQRSQRAASTRPKATGRERGTYGDSFVASLVPTPRADCGKLGAESLSSSSFRYREMNFIGLLRIA